MLRCRSPGRPYEGCRLRRRGRESRPGARPLLPELNRPGVFGDARRLRILRWAGKRTEDAKHARDRYLLKGRGATRIGGEDVSPDETAHEFPNHGYGENERLETEKKGETQEAPLKYPVGLRVSKAGRNLSAGNALAPQSGRYLCWG